MHTDNTDGKVSSAAAADSIGAVNSSPAPPADSAPGAPPRLSEEAKDHAIKKFIGTGLRYVVPVGISAGLVVWIFHKVDFHDVVRTVKEGCDFFWVAVMMLLTTLSHMIRGVRWGLQLRAAGVRRMPVVCEWVTIWGAYALNLIFSELGEAWRCVFVSRRQKAPLSVVIGTDIGDRSSDAVVVILLLALSLFVAHPFILDFLTKYALGRDVRAITDDPAVWIGIALVITVFWTLCRFFKTVRWVSALDASLRCFWEGFKVIFTMKKWWLYIILTLGIWTCYFFETYSVFMAFPFTRRFLTDPHMAAGFIPGLVVFVFGSMSMAVPSSGGLGPWNLAVMFALSLFGVSNTEGTAFSMVMWSCQAATLIALGLFSAGYVAATGHMLRKTDAISSATSESGGETGKKTEPTQ